MFKKDQLLGIMQECLDSLDAHDITSASARVAIWCAQAEKMEAALDGVTVTSLVAELTEDTEVANAIEVVSAYGNLLQCFEAQPEKWRRFADIELENITRRK